MIREIDGSPLDALVWGGKASGLTKLVASAISSPPAICFLPNALSRSIDFHVIKHWLHSHPAEFYVLRSSSLVEDLESTAGAGISTTLTNVVPDADHIRKLVINQLLPTLRGGSIILQVQVKCLYAGVVFVDGSTVTIEANLYSNTATTSGEPPSLMASMNEDKLTARMDCRQIGQPIVSILRQVGKICIKLSQLYGEKLDIEWVHDGSSCQIVQIRPLTRSLEE